MAHTVFDMSNAGDSEEARRILFGGKSSRKDMSDSIPPPSTAPVGRTFTLALPFHTATLNRLMSSMSARMSLKKNDRELICLLSLGLPPAFVKRRVDLTVIFVKGQRMPDKDAWQKSLFDSLVHAKLLFNDSPRWCEMGTVQYARGESKKMFIELTDV